MAIPQVAAATSNYAVGSIDRIAVCVWRGETTLEGVMRFSATIRSVSDRSAGPIVVLTVVESGIPMPSASSRAAITEMLGRAPSNVVASAVAIEADGFLAAAARSVVIGLVSFNRLPYPHRAFGSIPEASQFLSQHLSKCVPPISMPPGEIEEGVLAFRELIEQKG